jgi:hypothetical protein
MKEGDINTKYFHSVASERKKSNRIVKLKKEDGEVVEKEEAMKEVERACAPMCGFGN